ncbi:hypothetical protein MIMGU_mgv1a016873mg [Erythranthe guttata]|uniref:Uncharacterized protein n=1 Tax=Erythranthe guttata TaxID=4155 RepID=A0A022QFD8_ERYGU|nr:hypothetical protein MIMGU_mgv1a016873mg [Erythranthe guttata]
MILRNNSSTANPLVSTSLAIHLRAYALLSSLGKTVSARISESPQHNHRLPTKTRRHCERISNNDRFASSPVHLKVFELGIAQINSIRTVQEVVFTVLPGRRLF